MGYELLGRRGGYWSCTQHSWGDFINVAIAFGWQPQGAIQSKQDADDGIPASSGLDSYFGNDRQMVTAEDACAFAAAIRKAIVATEQDPNHLPDNQVTAIQAFLRGVADEGETPTICVACINEDLANLTQHLSKLADLAEAGEFKIA